MKFVCLGYMDEQIWARMSPPERDAMLQECGAYDNALRAGGHWVADDALQSARTARTLRWNGNKVVVTDGPFAETKEQLGGIVELEARDMSHAIELMTKHPGIRHGVQLEIRAVEACPLSDGRP